MKQRILLIGGSTAVGKSKFALELSETLNMEIISSDSVQVYKQLDLGTSKPTKEENEKCTHHLVDYVDVNETYNAFNFVTDATKYIKDIASRGKLPVIVGGTGLYMESLLYDYSFDKTQEDNGAIYDFNLYVLTQDREKLYANIDRRVDLMIENGLINEIKELKKQNIDIDNQCWQAIGYKEILSYLNGEIGLATAIQQMQQNTRNYAKRQITWFKHMNSIWVDVDTQWEQAKQEIIEKYAEYKR